MTEKECWLLIDDGIAEFKSAEGSQKGIRVDRKPQSDWLVFNWRQLTWESDDLHYLIEVFPKFEKEEIISWHIYTAVYYDLDFKRFYYSWHKAQACTLDLISGNAYQYIRDCFEHIIKVNRADIPFSVNLSR